MVEILLTGKDVRLAYDAVIDDTGQTITAVEFPAETRVGTLSVKNNLQRLYGLGDREYKQIIQRKFEGSMSIETVAYNASILNKFFTDEVWDKPIVIVYSLSGGTRTRAITNFIPQTVEVSIREDELIKASVDGVYVSETLYDDSYSVTLNSESDVIYPTHINATITAPDIDVDDISVRSLTLRTTLNNELKWGFHSRYGQAIAPKAIEHEVTVEAIFTEDMYNKVISGNDTSFDMTIEIEDSSGTTKITIQMTNCKVDNFSVPTEPNTELYATLTMFVGNITIS